MSVISPRENCILYLHERDGAYFQCCEDCNYVKHRCHFCGIDLTHDSYELVYDKEKQVHNKVRHWLSDCRPDLVYHEVGPLCTWPFRLDEGWLDRLCKDGKWEIYQYERDAPTCYAYESSGTSENHYKREWTTEHIHFMQDGPMV